MSSVSEMCEYCSKFMLEDIYVSKYWGICINKKSEYHMKYVRYFDACEHWEDESEVEE